MCHETTRLLTHDKLIGSPIDFRITPAAFKDFKGLELNHTIRIENTQVLLDQKAHEYKTRQASKNVLKRSLKAAEIGQPVNDTLKFYHPYERHLDWLRLQIISHSNIARAFTAGRSHEKHDQAGIIICSGPNNVVLHGLQHAREWAATLANSGECTDIRVTAAVVDFLIEQLLAGDDERISGYLEINRNWEFHWNEGGISNDPCEDDYRGPFAFSTPEARNIGKYLKETPNVVCYSKFQLWLTPYAHVGTPPANYETYLKLLAQGAATATENVNGLKFTAGDASSTVYQVSGISIEYAYSVGVGLPSRWSSETKFCTLFCQQAPFFDLTMATPEDSNVLRQLIDQIDGELSAFNAVAGQGSDQSLDSFGASQDSLTASEQGDSLSGSENYLGNVGQHQQKRTLPPSATSAIFGSTFERQLQKQPGATSLVMSGSYFMGPRAPQYIPSPLASPVSPESAMAEAFDQDAARVSGVEAQLKPSASHSSLSAAAADLLRGQQEQGQVTEMQTDDPSSEAADHHHDQQVPDDQVYSDDIKVDVTELYENFGQRKPVELKQSPMDEDHHDYKIEVKEAAQPSGAAVSEPLKLPELAFSSNDLTSLWTPGSGPIPASEHEVGARPRSQTYHGESSAVVPSADTLSDSSLFRGQVNTDKRKRLSLVTSGEGLAAAAAAASRAQMEKTQGEQYVATRSVLDLPSWDLAPLSPPVEVKEIPNASVSSTQTLAAFASPRRGSLGQRAQDLAQAEQMVPTNDILSPSSATTMTPTTPLTTKEARILAGREALLRMSPTKQRMQRGSSAGSTTSSATLLNGRSSDSTSPQNTARGDDDGGDSAALTSQAERARRASVKSQQSQRTHSSGGSSGVFGAVPERGHLTDVPPARLVFPDQSLRPIPLKAYRVRKMTLQERNRAYSQACEEFTRARTGLDVWALRCMMQDRPALMKNPPAIVRAVSARQVNGSVYPQTDTLSKTSKGSGGRMTPTTPHFSSSPTTTSTISSSHGIGIGARIKNASKRLSMDISGGTIGGGHQQPSIQDQVQQQPGHVSSGTGSLFYKQKSTRSAVELGSWSSGRARGLSNSIHVNTTAANVKAGTPPLPQISGGNHRSSIIGQGTMASAARGGMYGAPSGAGSGMLSHNKRNSLALGSPLSNSVRSRTMSDVQAGSRLSMSGRDPVPIRTSSDGAMGAQDCQAGGRGGPFSPAGAAFSSSYTGESTAVSPTATTSAFMERPIRRSLSTHYSRRPASIMVVPNHMGQATSNASLNSSSLSFGSAASLSTDGREESPLRSTAGADLRSSSTASSLTAGLKQQQMEQERSLQQEAAGASTLPQGLVYNFDGKPIPYADETTSKDEVYSPLTSPIMIPVGGFPAPKTGANVHGGWSSPVSAGGLTRPLTYAGQSTSTLSSNSSLVMSPSSTNREHSQQFHAQQQQQQQQQQTLNGRGSPAMDRSGGVVSQEPMKDKEPAEKLKRYSASSFSSLGSFARNHKRDSLRRLSKKDRKKETQEQQQQHQQQQLQAMSPDQRYSVSSSSLAQSPAHSLDHLTEQSLDKLSDVLPHVDRDRLSIYLQRAYGDEMVAIGLAMSDFRSGQL
ncbi:hypothetical protein BGZ70_008619 [Mortierella alpina]|uniref:Peptidase M14 domain-containing protein n=1 Tax=Mortierella alpina TaxID=64518 RepID=A0A9P6J5D4_MORAP|nr:hypothetical protein BGZ70_008619 [Mortierella alpina]